MHFLLYVCLPIDKAKTSLQARRRACKYLIDEQFVHNGRFCGICDYFSVGGRFSGILNLLRLKWHHPRKYEQFLESYLKLKAKDACEVLKNCFPDHYGIKPFYRNNVRFYGCPDDAQIMDEVLFSALKNGFSEEVSFGLPFKKPNVIFTDLCMEEWPTDVKSAAGRHWVVVIDYHG